MKFVGCMELAKHQWPQELVSGLVTYVNDCVMVTPKDVFPSMDELYGTMVPLMYVGIFIFLFFLHMPHVCNYVCFVWETFMNCRVPKSIGESHHGLVVAEQQHNQYGHLTLRQSCIPNAGRGLFARKDIFKGENDSILCHFFGSVLLVRKEQASWNMHILYIYIYMYIIGW
jgi:hypothetical protein